MLSSQRTKQSNFQESICFDVTEEHRNASAVVGCCFVTTIYFVVWIFQYTFTQNSNTTAKRQSQLEKKLFKETNLSTEGENMENGSSNLGLIWKGEVGMLPGSNLQFRINEFGDLDVLSEDETSGQKTDATFGQVSEATPSQKSHLSAKPKLACRECVTTTTQQTAALKLNISTCITCSTKGPSASFQGRFCSQSCIAKNVCDIKKRHETARRLPTEPVQTNELSLVLSPTNMDKPWSQSDRSQAPCSSFEAQSANDAALRKSSDERMDVTNIQKPQMIEQPKTKFSWKTYMELNKAVPVPEKVFVALHGLSPFPKHPNPFQVGCFVEAVDPDHQSEICLMRVAQVQGYRLRLHFVGDYSCYDIWANADWPLIFPCGFCSRTGRKLNVADQLTDEVRLLDLPALSSGQRFMLSNDPYKNSTAFKIGDKLEAVDRKNSDLICVATVADIIGEYLLIHFDGWHNEYDYWARFNAPSIHPVGWCQSNNNILAVPPNYKGVFSWQHHMKLTKSQAASVDCFSTYDHRKDVKIGMKLEVADHQNPLLIRVASIVAIDEHRIKVHYDGWGSERDVWMDMDSLDLHPPTWCLKTGHLLQPPVDLKNGATGSGCKTPGCKGMGHVRGTLVNLYYEKHKSTRDCPYLVSNIRTLRDRLSFNAEKNRSLPIKTSNGASEHVDCISDEVATVAVKSTGTSHGKGRKRRKQRKQIIVKKRTKSMESRGDSPAVNTLKHFNVDLVAEHSISRCWDKVVLALPGIQDVRAGDVVKWNVSGAAQFVTKLTGRSECADALTREEIDGEALMLLTQEDITKRLNIKLGPALKIFNAALLLKSMDEQ